MRAAIETLAENYDKKLDDPTIAEAFEIVEKYKNQSQNSQNSQTQNSQNQIFDILKEQFRPTSIKIGTVGAYLWGCSQNYYGEVNKSCSAFCNDNYLRQETIQPCQYQIWTYETTLYSTGHSFSSNAYIYINETWQGFTEKDVEKLKNGGVKYASVISTEDSKHQIIIPMTLVENLPILKEYQEVETEEVSYAKYYFLFFVIFLIALFVYFRMRNYKLN